MKNDTKDGSRKFLLYDYIFVGKSMEELLITWKNEALATLGVRHKGMDIEMYKVVAERRVGITSRLVLAILPKRQHVNSTDP